MMQAGVAFRYPGGCTECSLWIGLRYSSAAVPVVTDVWDFVERNTYPQVGLMVVMVGMEVM